jgi:tetracycline repressor-like protein
VFGPNAMRHFEQSLAAAATTGLPMERRLEVIAQVDDYVAGFVKGEHDLPAAPDGSGEEDGWAALEEASEAYLAEALASGDYPHVVEFLGGESFVAVLRRIVEGTTANERFDRGLERLLDGVQLEIDRLEKP